MLATKAFTITVGLLICLMTVCREEAEGFKHNSTGKQLRSQNRVLGWAQVGHIYGGAQCAER